MPRPFPPFPTHTVSPSAPSTAASPLYPCYRRCELARVFGMDFFSVLSRGSQFRVESIMYRLARPQNYALLSPAVQDRQSQRAMECIPLVLEPEVGAHYTSPVCVLDFRSLYPSVMIAHNLCFSTCLGKILDVGAPERSCPPARAPHVSTARTGTPCKGRSDSPAPP
jgi:DNA polymerase elongation subunit (family B)